MKYQDKDSIWYQDILDAGFECAQHGGDEVFKKQTGNDYMLYLLLLLNEKNLKVTLEWDNAGGVDALVFYIIRTRKGDNTVIKRRNVTSKSQLKNLIVTFLPDIEYLDDSQVKALDWAAKDSDKEVSYAHCA